MNIVTFRNSESQVGTYKNVLVSKLHYETFFFIILPLKIL